MSVVLRPEFQPAALRAARALWTTGRTGDILPDLLAALPSPLPAAAAAPLRALTLAVEAEDPLRASDVLLGQLVPLLEGAGVWPLGPATGGQGGGGTRRSSMVDPAGEAAAQRASLPRRLPVVVLLGAAHSRLARDLSRTSRTLFLWEDDARGRGAAQHLARDARATVHLLPARPTGSPPPLPQQVPVFVHPSLQGDRRHRAREMIGWLRAPRRQHPRHLPRLGPLRVVLLRRDRPFYGEDEWTTTLRALGHTVEAVDAPRLATEVERGRFRADLVFSVNGAALAQHPELGALLTHAGIPLVLWFVDDPELALVHPERLARPNVLALAWERQAVARLTGWGLSARYLPHACAAQPPQLRPRPDREGVHWVAASYRGDDRQRLRRAAPGSAVARQVRALLRDALLDDARLAPSVAVAALAAWPVAAHLFQRPADRCFLQATAADEAAAARREELARCLAPLGLTIHGDREGWAAANTGAQLCPHVPHAQRSRIYAAAAVNLDLVHPQMPTALSQRAFDVPGAGGLLLADDRPDLHEHFEVGREVLAFRSPDEACHLARWALARPDVAARLARAAARRVAAEHTFAHRARTLVRLLREHLA